MDKKYKLTDNFITHNGKKLFQIQAIKSFGDVYEGNLGGYIEAQNNLSQDDNAWVSGNACVYGNACVSGNALVSFKGNYLSVGPFGMNSRMITIGNNIVNAGCFSGTFEEFKNAVAKKYGNDHGGYAKAIQIIDNIKF